MDEFLETRTLHKQTYVSERGYSKQCRNTKEVYLGI